MIIDVIGWSVSDHALAVKCTELPFADPGAGEVMLTPAKQLAESAITARSAIDNLRKIPLQVPPRLWWPTQARFGLSGAVLDHFTGFAGGLLCSKGILGELLL